ncbi:uncharacterized protein LOC120253466 [Dioscorea cayenensis subsp. rotundata]|uniref:Uncharacterized protein LOC120253466 n=1 Tax=Dioscorea cayennensis subsp. rotundata TaxID=55577 RepID=A0AB40AS04_DIOCR|nr:uncharacterized protein LOC120253466 [Dioscorea cayenensis subsp. rotundata]
MTSSSRSHRCRRSHRRCCRHRQSSGGNRRWCTTRRILSDHREHLHQLLRRDPPIAVLVKHRERSTELAVDLLADTPSAPIASKLIPPSPRCSASVSITATSSSLGGSEPSFLSTPSSSLLVTFSRGSTDFEVNSSDEEFDPNDDVSDLAIVRAGLAFFHGLAGDPKRDPI